MTSSLSLIALLIASIAAISSASAQVDPYAKEMTQARAEHFKKEWNEFSSQAEMVLFASDCKAVIGNIDPLISSLYPSDLDFPFGILPHKNVREVIEDAKRAALARASSPGGCNFWHEHPDAVYAIRKAAETAFYRR